jgi:hypothetical protein
VLLLLSLERFNVILQSFYFIIFRLLEFLQLLVEFILLVFPLFLDLLKHLGMFSLFEGNLLRLFVELGYFGGDFLSKFLDFFVILLI